MTTKKTGSKATDTSKQKKQTSSQNISDVSKTQTSVEAQSGATIKTQIDDFKHGFHMAEE